MKLLFELQRLVSFRQLDVRNQALNRQIFGSLATVMCFQRNYNDDDDDDDLKLSAQDHKFDVLILKTIVIAIIIIRGRAALK